MFCEQVDMPIIGRVLNKLEDDKIRIEHWIQEIKDETIFPSVQLPVIKKCRGCEIKTDQARSKRNKLNTRCVTNISAEKCVIINASSIQNDRYMVDNSIYEVLAQAECKHHRGSNKKARNIEKINGLLRYIYPKVIEKSY